MSGDPIRPRRTGRGALTLQAIRPKRLYQQIAEQVCEMAREGRLRPGDRLPSEHELARQLGVSRPSVREAMIVLETVGLIEVRTGSGAWLRATPPPAGLPTFAVGPGPLEQFKARFLLECELAGEAARHASDAEIDALEAIVDRTEAAIAAEPRVTPEHFLFHEKLAEASGNSVLALFVRQLIALMDGEESLWRVPRERVDSFEQLSRGVAARRRIVDCLRRRDARGAKAAMREHLRRVGRLYFGDSIE